MKTKILQELYDTNFVQLYVKKLLNSADIEHYEDYIQEIFLILCEYDENKLIELYTVGGINKVRQLASGIICRQIKSKTSPLYYKYKKKQNITDSIHSYKVDDIEQEMRLNNRKNNLDNDDDRNL